MRQTQRPRLCSLLIERRCWQFYNLTGVSHWIGKRGKEWENRLQKRIEKRQAKGKNADKLIARQNETKARVSELVQSIYEIHTLKNSTQEYHIDANWTPQGSDGRTEYNPNTGAIDINISKSYGIAGFIHEVDHGFQFDKGLTDFSRGGVNRGFLHDITDEISAFRKQYAYDPRKVGTARSIFDITETFVRPLNPDYLTLPSVALNINSSQLLIFTAHKMVNLSITTTPIFSEGVKSYKTSTLTFSSYIHR